MAHAAFSTINVKDNSEASLLDLRQNAPELLFFAYLDRDANFLLFAWEDENKYPGVSKDQLCTKANTAMRNFRYTSTSRQNIIESIVDLCQSAYISGYTSFSDLEEITGFNGSEMRELFLAYMNASISQEYKQSSAHLNLVTDGADNIVHLPVKKRTHS